ncbi:hypothetical protein QTP88_010725 [Uroleucon formosanum]
MYCLKYVIIYQVIRHVATAYRVLSASHLCSMIRWMYAAIRSHILFPRSIVSTTSCGVNLCPISAYSCRHQFSYASHSNTVCLASSMFASHIEQIGVKASTISEGLGQEVTDITISFRPFAAFSQSCCHANIVFLRASWSACDLFVAFWTAVRSLASSVIGGMVASNVTASMIQFCMPS